MLYYCKRRQTSQLKLSNFIATALKKDINKLIDIKNSIHYGLTINKHWFR